ncbi:hypothetical protein [Bacteroides sp. 519]|uniref:hypothetical protein n=1 Tax=Bacteroides sp. 519 TaxID=2302937 RepID=UPI0013D09A41|nr:hypothetical protein [Bacteroides sp. 519]NDV58622.1 hypothetical protein [Bacteroides sp. 519]
MTNKIKELRKIVPIPMGEALQLLKSNDGDVEKCVYLFKAKSIAEICEQTGCDKKMAAQYYEEEKLDINKAISAVKNVIFDTNYVPINGLTAQKIRMVYDWFRLIGEYDLGASLNYPQLDVVIETFSLIESTKELSVLIAKAKEANSSIFEGYSDTDPLEEFVCRSQKLDNNPDFRAVYTIVSQSETVIKETLNKHLRNLVRLGLE